MFCARIRRLDFRTYTVQRVRVSVRFRTQKTISDFPEERDHIVGEGDSMTSVILVAVRGCRLSSGLSRRKMIRGVYACKNNYFAVH